MTSDLDGSATRSGKYYQTTLEGGISAYNLLQEPAMQDSLTTSPTQTCKGNNSPILPPTLDSDMAAHLKLPTFKGVGDEDMDRFWFVADSVWTVQNVVSDMVKRAQLSLAFKDRALDWYMQYIAQNGGTSIQDIRDALKHQFKKPKSYSQLVA